jgi:GNAT superfamily N-acetyltransferase
MTDAEFKQLAAEMKQVLDPELVLILEDAGTPFAFSITLPNLNEALVKVKNGRLLPLGLPKILFQAKVVGIRECRTALMGIRPSYRGRGLDALLNLATIENGQRLGYSGCEMSWVLDTNPRLLSALKQLNAVVDKEYAMFEKTLDQPRSDA